MTIIEAIKSGRMFKLKSWKIWNEPGSAHTYCTDDILSDQWEVIPTGRSKLRAWVDDAGTVKLIGERNSIPGAYWTRAEWLDEK